MARYSLLNGAPGALALAWSLEGLSSAVISERLHARGVNVSEAAVRRFLGKRRAAKDEALDRAVTLATAPAIAEKAWRTSQAQRQNDELRAIVETRGWMAKDRKWLGGEFGREVEIERFDAALSKELRELRREVAEELGQIPSVKANEGDGAAVHIHELHVSEEQLGRMLDAQFRRAP
jgi:hypothetical protein